MKRMNTGNFLLAASRRLCSFTVVVLMTAATTLLLSSCDDDDARVDTGLLCGTWEELYDEGVVSEGMVYYSFVPESETHGMCVIDVSDVLSGNYTLSRVYDLLDDGRRILIHKGMFGGDNDPVSYDIRRLTTKELEWNISGRPDIVMRFKRSVTRFNSNG